MISIFFIIVYLACTIQFSETCLTENHEFIHSGQNVPYGISRFHIIVYSVLALDNCSTHESNLIDLNENVLILLVNAFNRISVTEKKNEHSWHAQSFASLQTYCAKVGMTKKYYACSVTGENVAFSLTKTDFDRYGR